MSIEAQDISVDLDTGLENIVIGHVDVRIRETRRAPISSECAPLVFHVNYRIEHFSEISVNRKAQLLECQLHVTGDAEYVIDCHPIDNGDNELLSIIAPDQNIADGRATVLRVLDDMPVR